MRKSEGPCPQRLQERQTNSTCYIMVMAEVVFIKHRELTVCGPCFCAITVLSTSYRHVILHVWILQMQKLKLREVR